MAVWPGRALSSAASASAATGVLVMVVGSRRGTLGAARAACRRLVREEGTACALLVLHRECTRAGAAARPAVPRARRRAQELRETGFAATAAGRVVTVELDGSVSDAARTASELLGGPDPVVLVLDTARDDAWNTLLARSSEIVLVCDPSAPPVLATLAATELAAIAPGVPITPTPGPGGRGR